MVQKKIIDFGDINLKKNEKKQDSYFKIKGSKTGFICFSILLIIILILLSTILIIHDG